MVSTPSPQEANASPVSGSNPFASTPLPIGSVETSLPLSASTIAIRLLLQPENSRRCLPVYTDVWVSMSDDESEAARRREALAPYRLDEALLDRAAPHAIALHCLPAHPGEEISEGVLYGDRQRIWDEAENRRHAQKALLEMLVS